MNKAIEYLGRCRNWLFFAFLSLALSGCVFGAVKETKSQVVSEDGGRLYNEQLYHSVFGLPQRAQHPVTGKGVTVAFLEPENIFRVTKGFPADRYVNPLIFNGRQYHPFKPQNQCTVSTYECGAHATSVISDFGGKGTGMAKDARVMPITWTVNGGLIGRSLVQNDDTYKVERQNKAISRYNGFFASLFHKTYDSNVLAVSNSWGDPTYFYDRAPKDIPTGVARYYDIYRRYPFSPAHKAAILKTPFVQLFLNRDKHLDQKKIPIWIWATGNRKQVSKQSFLRFQKMLKTQLAPDKALEAEQQLLRADDPRYLAGLPAALPTEQSAVLQKYWIAVTAVHTIDEKGAPLLRPGSPAYTDDASGDHLLLYNPVPCYNRLGIDMRKWCMASEGVYSVAATIKKNKVAPPVSFSGTSAATPEVAAGLALIYEKFNSHGNSMSKSEARQRLLQTARHVTSSGRRLRDHRGQLVKTKIMKIANWNGKGYYRQALSKDYGHGIMRLDIALSPVGKTYLADGSSTFSMDRFIATDGTNLFSSPAFGDGMTQSFSRQKTIFFDSLGSPFTTTLGPFASQIQPRSASIFFTAQPLSAMERAYGAGSMDPTLSFVNVGSFDPHRSPLGFASASFLPTLFSGDINVTYAPTDSVWQRFLLSRSGKALLYGTGIFHKFGWLHIGPIVETLIEDDSVLGGTSSGGLSLGTRSYSMFLGIHVFGRYAGLDVSSFYIDGTTEVRGNTGAMVDSVGAIKTRAMGAYLRRGPFGIGVTLPLRVSMAPLNISYAVRRDEKGRVYYAHKNINIRPSGRQKTIEAFFEHDAWGGTIRISGFYTVDKGHVKNFDEQKIGIFYQTTF